MADITHIAVNENGDHLEVWATVVGCHEDDAPDLPPDGTFVTRVKLAEIGRDWQSRFHPRAVVDLMSHVHIIAWHTRATIECNPMAAANNNGQVGRIVEQLNSRNWGPPPTMSSTIFE